MKFKFLSVLNTISFKSSHMPIFSLVLVFYLLVTILVKNGRKSDTYLTHICRLPWCIESPQRIDKKPELSAHTVLSSAVEVD